jgi:hypothetical protein
VPRNGVILNTQAVKFNKLLSRDEIVKSHEGWLWKLKVLHKMFQINSEGKSVSDNAATAGQFLDTV